MKNNNFVVSRVERIAKENGWKTFSFKGYSQNKKCDCTVLEIFKENRAYTFEILPKDSVDEFLSRMGQIVERLPEGDMRWLYYSLCESA